MKSSTQRIEELTEALKSATSIIYAAADYAERHEDPLQIGIWKLEADKLKYIVEQNEI